MALARPARKLVVDSRSRRRSTPIAAALVFVGPYLTAGLEKPDDPELAGTYERFERDQGVDEDPAARSRR